MSANPEEIPLYRQRAVCQAVQRLISDTEAQPELRLDSVVRITLAGGAAMALYSPSRLSEDVDAIFSRSIPLPETIVYYQGERGERRTMSWDRNYSPTLGLLHPDAESDALFVSRSPGGTLDVMVLTPTDLAVTKLGRYAENDQRDILDLYHAGLVHPETLHVRAREALEYYIGNHRQVAHNITCALENMGSTLTVIAPEIAAPITTIPPRTEAQRLIDGSASEFPAHNLDNGAITGRLQMMSEDRSVAYLAKNHGLIMVYRGDGKTMPWLSAQKGKEISLDMASQPDKKSLSIDEVCDAILACDQGQSRIESFTRRKVVSVLRGAELSEDGLSKKDLAFLERCLLPLATSSGITQTDIVTLVKDRLGQR